MQPYDCDVPAPSSPTPKIDSPLPHTAAIEQPIAVAPTETKLVLVLQDPSQENRSELATDVTPEGDS
jgi:hypothetical protein